MSGKDFSPRGSRGAGGGDYPLPPALARLPSGPGRLPKEFLEQGHRDRILLAALEVFGTKGLAATTVQDLIEEAGASRETFYRSFSGKEECFVALHDELLGWLTEEARDAGAGSEDWGGSVVSVGGRLVSLLVSDPRIARICAVEYLLGGREVMARHEAAVSEMGTALRGGRAGIERGHELPDSLEILLLSGSIALLGRALAKGGKRSSRTLVRELPELVLIFYVGPEEARRIAGS